VLNPETEQIVGVVSAIDEALGEQYARKNPELVGDVLKASAMNRLAAAVRSIAEAILKSIG